MCKIRLCHNCGQETEYEYSEEEWIERGCICEFCEQENGEDELIALDIL